eukprot:TRINITY_DN1744_c0_g1_i2.p1 TRINITY_DN1744_c0_g1~~TRINITY_DN1744_c0_g1_i2.p1  ORF type:complete len:390 (+),score=75.35 TRINITY_DN1744_c0_g1_i2:26-1195(+)
MKKSLSCVVVFLTFVTVSLARISLSKDGTLIINQNAGTIKIEGDVEVQGRSLSHEISVMRKKISQANQMALNWLPTLAYQKFGRSKGSNFFTYNDVNYVLVAAQGNPVYQFNGTVFVPVGSFPGAVSNPQFEVFKMDGEVYAMEINSAAQTQLHRFVPPNFVSTGENIPSSTVWRFFEVNGTRYLAGGSPGGSVFSNIYARASNSMSSVGQTTIRDEIKDWVQFSDATGDYLLAIGGTQYEILYRDGPRWRSLTTNSTTNGLSAGTFQIGNVIYVVIGQRKISGAFTVSTVMRWQRPYLVEISQIITEIPMGIEVFKLEDTVYCFISNQNLNGQNSPKLMRWKNNQFESLLNDLPLIQNYRAEYFQLQQKDYLFVASTDSSSLYKLGLV